MSPRRPSSHLISDESLLRLHAAFLSRGWAVEELDKDYGQDLLVRIFEMERATAHTFYIQAKATAEIERYRTADGRFLRFPCRRANFEHWLDFWEPVFLTVWDRNTDETYWELAQEPERRWDERSANFYCYVPLDNRLDDVGLRRIENRTKSRHERYEYQKLGAEILVERLETVLNVKIEYNPEAGVLVVQTPEGDCEVTVFGKLASAVAATGLDPSELLDEALERRRLADAEFAAGRSVTITDELGAAVQVRTMSDFARHLARSGELDL